MRFLGLFVFLALNLTLSFAQARDLTSRLGVGYRNSLVTMSLPSVAAFYYPSPDVGVLGSLGVDTEDNNSKFAFAGGVRRIIFKEDNMNFFAAGQVAMVNQEVASAKDSGFEIAATVGGEFFLQGLESLGFNFETGMGITTVKKTRFRTLGDSFINAGMVFYF
ncbi:MAG: organic solvent tolerance protein [Pseudobdellovibrionaceae bacterium]